jgi:hypothetical protein
MNDRARPVHARQTGHGLWGLGLVAGRGTPTPFFAEAFGAIRAGCEPSSYSKGPLGWGEHATVDSRVATLGSSLDRPRRRRKLRS